MNLHVIVTGEWFNKHLRCGKDIEYRDINEHWRKRLFDHQGEPKPFKTITIQHGYKKDAPRIIKECKGLSIGEPMKGWAPPSALGCRFYQIHCGSIIQTQNIDI